MLDCETSDDDPTLIDLKNFSVTYISFKNFIFQVAFGQDRVPPNENAEYYVIQDCKPKKCETCLIHSAGVEVTESLILPLSPTYLCKPCYKELFPNDESNVDCGFAQLMT